MNAPEQTASRVDVMNGNFVHQSFDGTADPSTASNSDARVPLTCLPTQLMQGSMRDQPRRRFGYRRETKLSRRRFHSGGEPYRHPKPPGRIFFANPIEPDRAEYARTNVRPQAAAS